MEESYKINKVRQRYNRLACIYDFIEVPLEFLRIAGWRDKLRSRITVGRALEVGVGTGKNLAFYPSGVEISAIDLSRRMLLHTRKKALRRNQQVSL